MITSRARSKAMGKERLIGLGWSLSFDFFINGSTVGNRRLLVANDGISVTRPSTENEVPG
jgi:hypothetical protein